ncbi:ribosome biogenesis factor YjgA [Kushneria indalinina]|uniref:Dual-action ribosomal maturation protein DarP n=1 Tax=Kushneria indalinina DSM 14324 TaxID=1122140 RepID=A0A3D9E0K4_9GAMM|nr:ribosome biogenesis factor YjgA [Kushneria indalinina]REC96557.1 ribosome-associated protein [Kushneria indalinina DSM 14324]
MSPRKKSRAPSVEETPSDTDSPHDAFHHDNGRPNKTRLKQEAQDLKELGEQIIALSDKERARLPLSDDLLAAIDETRRITSREARRRHMQYVGKIMRAEYLDEIRAEFDTMAREKRQRELGFHHLEQWRDRLIEGDSDTVTAFVNEYPDVDRQTLGQLVRNARAERAADKPPASARKLFRLIRDTAGL